MIDPFKANQRPWRWVDEYDFDEHAEHQKQGLDADCENIKAGRIRLVDSSGKTVLQAWADYGGGDYGLDISLEDAELIVNAVNSFKI